MITPHRPPIPIFDAPKIPIIHSDRQMDLELEYYLICTIFGQNFTWTINVGPAKIRDVIHITKIILLAWLIVQMYLARMGCTMA